MLIEMFADLYDPLNEEIEDHASEPEGGQDAAFLSSILKEELQLYQTMKGQLMMDGPTSEVVAAYTGRATVDA